MHIVKIRISNVLNSLLRTNGEYSHENMFVYKSSLSLNYKRFRGKVSGFSFTSESLSGLTDCSLLVTSILSFSHQTDLVVTAISHELLEFFFPFLLVYIWKKVVISIHLYSALLRSILCHHKNIKFTFLCIFFHSEKGLCLLGGISCSISVWSF